MTLKIIIIIICILVFILLSTINFEYLVNRASDFRLNYLAYMIELILVFLLIYLPITKIKTKK